MVTEFFSENGATSPVLHEANVPIVSNPVCNDQNHYDGLVDDTMICAGFEQGDKDTCQVVPFYQPHILS